MKFKTLTILTFFVATTFVAYSQEPTVTKYLITKANERTDDESIADYSVIDSTWSDNTSSSNSFYLNPESPRYTQGRGNDGEKYSTWYYRSGAVQKEGLFDHQLPVGVIVFKYEDGRPMGEVEFPKDHKAHDAFQNYRIRQYWDSLGNKLVDNDNGYGYINFKSFERPLAIEASFITPGTGKVVSGKKEGVWTGKTDRGVYEETYEKGKLTKGTQKVDGNTYSYTQIEIQPEFPGGINKMMLFVRHNLKYPSSARRMGIEGSVFTEFMVEVDGSITGIKTLKGVNKDLDAEAVRVVSRMPKWTPGLLRGLPVRVWFVFPLKFKLG